MDADNQVKKVIQRLCDHKDYLWSADSSVNGWIRYTCTCIFCGKSIPGFSAEPGLVIRWSPVK